jgi:hypothetical protein
MGIDLMPWQQDVLDISLEHDPTTGDLVYRQVVITVPRQSGKTLLLMIVALHRMTTMAKRMTPVLVDMRRPDKVQRVALTAQSGNDARRKMQQEWIPTVLASPLSRRVTVNKRGVGTEIFGLGEGEWEGTMEIISSVAHAGHGRVTDLAIMDEAFADSDEAREQGLVPGMNTRPSPQLWVVSTAGDDKSIYLRRKVEKGRLMVEEGRTEVSAYFEWSAPADADADDEDVWRACMPALGTVTPVDAIRSARLNLSDGEFRRAYLNQWVQGNDKVIPIDRWIMCEHRAKGVHGTPVFCLDLNPHRTHASLAVSDGTCVELVASYDDGNVDAAVADAIKACGSSNLLVMDANSPIASKVPELEEAGVAVRTFNMAEVKDACGEFYDAIRDTQVGIMHHQHLTAAAEGARKRHMGDRFIWTRNHPNIDLTPLTAVTFAYHGARRHQPVNWDWLMGDS